MDAGDWIRWLFLAVLVGEAFWIRRITKKYWWVQSHLSRASAKVAQHKILIADLQQLLEDDTDLDRCLREEVDGKAYERAREVEYEQNKSWYDTQNSESPWIPKTSPK